MNLKECKKKKSLHGLSQASKSAEIFLNKKTQSTVMPKAVAFTAVIKTLMPFQGVLGSVRFVFIVSKTDYSKSQWACEWGRGGWERHQTQTSLSLAFPNRPHYHPSQQPFPAQTPASNTCLQSSEVTFELTVLYMDIQMELQCNTHQ